MDEINYYSILGVNTDSSESEITKAFRKAAFESHPDRNPDDPEAEERFKIITEAKDTLTEKEKRSAYDKFLASRKNDWILTAPPEYFEPYHIRQFAQKIGKRKAYKDSGEYFEDVENDYDRLAEILTVRPDLAAQMVKPAIEEQLSGARSSLFSTMLENIPEIFTDSHLVNIVKLTFNNQDLRPQGARIIRDIITVRPDLRGFARRAQRQPE
jgi:curved DNA-binding protein CbpA